ncbi:hypothetical protein FPOAC1_008203 [Fusarium poae]|uniref:hypothetical protein n=1 Tax=Fusarium poae TaxID=36050 RepID=UPI001CE9502A|nr:hypothetical protein FPOAC1_008203 [Fusarium poae]KAG8668819.1 hypothetical protein FPOAC1_008203 [Fusarium poae]
MANSGYANAGNLNDAKELQKMFKGQGSSNITAKPRGKSKTLETFPHPHRGPPPTSTNVPPPSARYYTATLLSDPLKRVPGAILGTATLAFLSRQDSAPQTPTIPAQTAKPLIAENQAPIKAPATVSAGEIKSANKEEQSKGVAAKPPVMGNQAPATVFSGERKQVTTAVSAGENLQVPAIVSTGEGKQIPTIVSTGETKVANKEGESKKSLASMFFSLMSGDSDEDSDEESPAVKVNAEAVSKSATTGVIKYSSDELLELKGKLPLEPAKIVLQQKHRGKTELSPEAMANTSLRPEAPGFIPSVAAKMAAHLANEPNKPVKDRKPTKGLGSSMWAK